MTPQILRNSALSIPLGVLAGAFASWGDAGSALVSSIVCVGNLWLLSILSERAIDALASQELELENEVAARGDGFGATLWLGAIAVKFMLLLVLYGAMLQFLPPFGLAMGFVPLMMGVFITGLQHAFAESGREE